MSEQTLDSVVSKFMECLTRQWSDALGRQLGAAYKVTFGGGTFPDPGANPLCMGITFEGAVVGDATLVITSADLEALSKKAGDGTDATPQPPSAIIDDLRQSLVLALKDFQEQHGALVGRIDPCPLPTGAELKATVLEASCEGLPAIHLYFISGENLRVNNAAAENNAVPAGGENFDLIMDAGLEVTLRFGQQQMSLAKLAALGPGAVVELDRKVEDPIELILGGRVLARGEVMIVDGNYGLRVTELCERNPS